MKKLIFTIIWLTALLFCPFLANSQNFFDDIKEKNEDDKILVLTHPTVSNLKTFATLVEEGLVDLPDYRFVGVFYDKERYNFSETKKFLDTASTLPVDFFLHRIEDTLSKDELFKTNPLTDDFKKIFDNSEGVIFFGGPDLPPSTYKEKTNLLTSIYDPHRHYFELSFLFHLLGGKQQTHYESLLSQNPDYLIYGFCLGMQTMNVAAGGTMIQDIPTQLYGLNFAEDVINQNINKRHRNYHRMLSIDNTLLNGSFHQIHFLKESFLKSFSKEQILPVVYSNHHQAIKTLGKGFEKIATSLDEKVPEAIQHKKFDNVKGVQFHPEARFLYKESDRFKLQPGDTIHTTGEEMLEEGASMDFHKRFWEDFSNRLNER